MLSFMLLLCGLAVYGQRLVGGKSMAVRHTSKQNHLTYTQVAKLVAFYPLVFNQFIPLFNNFLISVKRALSTVSTGPITITTNLIN